MNLSYDDSYAEDVASNIGTMLEYASKCKIGPLDFWQLFISSYLAAQIEKGNPHYLTGISAVDYFNMILQFSSSAVNDKEDLNEDLSFDEYYWSGYVLARLQQKTDLSFIEIERKLPLKEVLKMFPTLHEADISKFYEVALRKIKSFNEETNLKRIRSAVRMSQNKLAKVSGINIRSIQMYEQRHNDINKAQGETLYKIAKSLGCNIADILEKL